MTFESLVVPAAAELHSTPFLALLVPQGPCPASLAALDAASEGALARCYSAGDFSGKKDEAILLYPAGPRPRILLLGTGTPGEGSRNALRRAAAVGAKRARITGVPSMAIWATPESWGAATPTDGGDGRGLRAAAVRPGHRPVSRPTR